jgi:hypothetical protein
MAQFNPARRLTLFLPVNDPRERRAAAIVAAAVRSMFPGSTQTRFDPAPFVGYWVEDGAEVIYTDDIALVFVDVEDSVVNTATLEVTASKLREAMFHAYEGVGSPQAEVWIVQEELAVYR